MMDNNVKKIEQKSYGYSYLPIAGDYLLRWVILVAWRTNLINDLWFWLGNAILIPILSIIVTMARADKIGRQLGFNGTATSNPTGWSFLFFVFVLFSGSYISYWLYPEWSNWIRVLLAIGVFIVYGFYILVLYVFSPQNIAKPVASDKEGTQAPLEVIEFENMSVNENDIEILRLQTEIRSINQRIDTYTLESTLFGALAFSAFVAFIVSDKPLFAGVERLTSQFGELFNLMGAFDFSMIGKSLNTMMSSDQAIIAAITIETLTCSMFFLSAIVSRLRISDATKDVERLIVLAESYNRKEEDTLNLKLDKGSNDVDRHLDERLRFMTDKVIHAIQNAQDLHQELKPLVGYMRISRDLGVANFLVILITSALLISHELAFIFIAVAFLAYSYTTIDRWARSRRLLRVFQRIEKVFHLQSSMPVNRNKA